MILHFTYWKKSGVKFNEKTITGEGGGRRDLKKPILKGSNGRGVAQGGEDVVTSNWSMHYGTSSIHGSGS